MAKIPKKRPADPAITGAIVDQIEQALLKLGASQPLASKARTYGTDALLAVVQKLEGQSDLLGIMAHYREMDDQWVLDQLRRWNANRAPKARSAVTFGKRV